MQLCYSALIQLKYNIMHLSWALEKLVGKVSSRLPGVLQLENRWSWQRKYAQVKMAVRLKRGELSLARISQYSSQFPRNPYLCTDTCAYTHLFYPHTGTHAFTIYTQPVSLVHLLRCFVIVWYNLPHHPVWSLKNMITWLPKVSWWSIPGTMKSHIISHIDKTQWKKTKHWTDSWL